MTRRVVRLCPPATALPPLVGPAILALLAAPAPGQQPAPRWTGVLELGAQFPTTLYDGRVSQRVGASGALSTRYRERVDAAPLLRVGLRYRPEGAFSAYLALQLLTAGTRAQFVGGGAGPERFRRRVRIWAAEGGAAVQLRRWAEGRGLLEYTVGPVLVHHTLDLSGGHRDEFARHAGAPDTGRLRWSDRAWAAWGLAVAAGARIPVGDRLLLRVAGHDHVVAVPTGRLEALEREDVFRLSGRAPVFLFNAFTAHYPTVRVGLEYVLSRLPPPAVARAALPPPPGRAPPSAAALEAARLAAAGDTAAALAVLRRRVSEAPEDASAWRELALLLGAQAETQPAVRPEAWEALARAVRANPDDDAVLAAYGRLRALLARAGADRPAAPPPALRGLQADGGPGGTLFVAWSVAGLAPGPDGAGRFRLRLEVFGPDGAPVPVRLAGAPGGDTEALEFERGAPAGAAEERLELRLARAVHGPHTLRLRLTDLVSGHRIERAAGFVLP